MKKKTIITFAIIIIILFLISLPFIPSKDRKLEKEYSYLKDNLYEDYMVFQREGNYTIEDFIRNPVAYMTKGEIRIDSNYDLYCENGEEIKELNYYSKRYVSCAIPFFTKIGVSCSKKIDVLDCGESYWIVSPRSSGPFQYTWYGSFEK